VVKLCQAITCPLWPFRGGVHPYTQKRLQEAVPDEAAAEAEVIKAANRRRPAPFLG
jgi:hypothetical protein